METIHISLKDGKVLEVPRGTSAAEVAQKISPRLAKDALVARVSAGNGDVAAAKDGAELVDLSRRIERDAKLEILTDKDADALFVFRHSAAHLLAAAVIELFPEVKLGIGPPIEYGFLYEFLREQPFTPEDLAAIEKRMHEIASRDVPNERKMLPKPEAIDLYKNSSQTFK